MVTIGLGSPKTAYGRPTEMHAQTNLLCNQSAIYRHAIKIVINFMTAYGYDGVKANTER